MDEIAGTLLSAASIVIAALALVIAAKTLRETQRMREAATDPEVAVYLDVDPDSRIMSAVLTNTGQGAAYNVSVTFNDVVPELAGYRLSDVGFFKGAHYIAPGKSFPTVVGSTVTVLGDDGVGTANVTVRYRNRAGKSFSEPFVLDPNVFQNVMRVHRDPLEKAIVKAINKQSQETRAGLREVSQSIAIVGTLLGDDPNAPDEDVVRYYKQAEERFPFRVGSHSGDEDGSGGNSFSG